MAEANQTHAKELADKVKDQAKAAVDEARDTIQETVDDVAETVTRGKDKLEGNVRQIRARSRVQSAIDQAADRAHELADWSISATFDGVEQAREAYDHYSRETTRYIRRQPVKSVLVAAGVGAVLASLLVGSISRKR
ncbi:MAG: hypothetical protein GAK30_01220 [Paracidovorax wautersii]|uniref:Membrane-anchored ribosome-binding protein, inhibits growth in stationary phase, ElaB/YqjD/DUF883 family n=1 Tax=Paracidovorax wautersii TaxID=1177982 RepID=A0A7V8FQH5_9BURK|nr:MAG: hypothetical protein GAK30_01220 [Paracidovorax wautersii]